MWPDIAKQLESSGLGDAVRFTGFVSQSDMRVIFEMAHAVIFPSLFEGAGLGVVEAMHMGKPIACSDIPAFREYVGAGAYYFDPHDVQAIAHALYIVMKDEQIRTELLKTVRSSQLDNWRDVARQYIQIYRRADAARRTSRGLLCDETPQSPILTSA